MTASCNVSLTMGATFPSLKQVSAGEMNPPHIGSAYLSFYAVSSAHLPSLYCHLHDSLISESFSPLASERVQTVSGAFIYLFRCV